MLHKNLRLFVVLFVILSAVLVPVSGIRTALAGACRLEDIRFDVNTMSGISIGMCDGGHIGGHRIRALRPDGSGFDVYELSTGNITFTLDRSELTQTGDYLLIAEMHGGEGWGSAVMKDFSFFYQAPGQPPTSISEPKYPNAAIGDGGVDLTTYCKSIGYDVEQHSENDAYSFRCVKDQQVWYIDWNKVCPEVWGAARPYPTLSNSTELGAWKCMSQPGYIDPKKENTNSGDPLCKVEPLGFVPAGFAGDKRWLHIQVIASCPNPPIGDLKATWMVIDGQLFDRDDGAADLRQSSFDWDTTNITGTHTFCAYAQSARDPDGKRVGVRCQQYNVDQNSELIVQPTPKRGNTGIDKNGKPFDRDVPFVAGIPSLSQAKQQGNPGGVDVSVYCAALGYSSNPGHAQDGTQNAAYSWYCVKANGGKVSIDWNYLCYQVYGDGYTAVNTAGQNRVGGWKCVQGNGYTPPQPTQPQTLDSCGVTPRLKPGDRGRVIDPEPEWVMDRASFLKPAQKLGELVEGTEFTVISGPHCGSGKGGAVNFYEVQADNGIRGFVGEGYSSYWLEPIQVQTPPTAVPQRSEVWLGPPYTDCVKSFTPNDSPHEPLESVQKGFTLANADCNKDSGNIYLFAAALGGAGGDPNSDEPTRQSIAQGEMVYVYVPNFTGNLRIDVNVQLNGKLFMTATGLKAIVPTLEGEIGGKLVEIFGGPYAEMALQAMSASNDVVRGSRAYVTDEVYLRAQAGREVKSSVFSPTVSQQEVIFPGTREQMAKSWIFDNLNVPVSVIIPVRQGEPVEVHTGIKVVANIHGMAYFHWLPSTSRVTSIVFTQTR